jgi:DNA-binding response OmpR family regulator
MTNNDKLILLAEDDLHLGMVIQDALLAEGYKTHLATNGLDALELFNKNTYQLCILDVMMPKMDGITLSRSIKKIQPAVPVFFLTAKNQTEDKIAGFKAGADDYLTKPFSTEEFLLRVSVLLRRTGNQVAQSPIENVEVKVGDCVLDTSKSQLKIKEETIRLSPKECKVLKILAENSNRLVERDVLLTRIWGNTSYFNGRSLDVYIAKLRKHLSNASGIQIINVHGSGFMLEISE